MKINKKAICYLVLLIGFHAFPGMVISQSKFRFGLGFQTGVEAGWWIYNKGFNDTLPGNHMGYDRTHLSFLTPSELKLSFRSESWMFNLGVGRARIGDNVMIGSEDRRRDRTRYAISSGNAVSVSRILIQGGPALIKKEKYRFYPALTLGLFSLETTHPDRFFFATKWLWKLSLENHISLSKGFDLLVNLAYTDMKIFTTSEAPVGSEHDIYSIGINLGANIWFK
ncbi:MAG: hypothetical protein R3B93_16080 [Bacteroidia bacterium]